MSSTIELPYNEPLPFKQKNVFNHRITIEWTFTFQTKKCLQPSNYHTMNLYLSNKKMSSTIQLPYNEPLTFKQKTSSTIELPYNEPLYFNKKKTSSTIDLPYNKPLPFKQKNVFNHRITIQWTFTFQTKKCLQPSNYHTMKLYLSNKKMFQPSNYHTMNLYISIKKTSTTIDLPYNKPLPFEQKNVFNHRLTIKEPLPFKQKHVFKHPITIQWNFTFPTKKCFNHRITIQWTFTFQTKNVFNHRITIQWTFNFQTKKCLQPSNYHTMNLYISNKKMSSTIKLPYNEPLPLKKKCLQPSNYHTMNLYLSNKKMSSTIELPYNEPLTFKRKNVFNHRITIQWNFTFQTKKCLQPSNYHTMNLYLSHKNMSSNIELPYNETLPFQQKNVSTIELPYNEPLPFKQKNVFNHRITIQWTFTFLTKKCLQPSNYHTMNLYL